MTERSLYNVIILIESNTKVVLESSHNYKPITNRMKCSELRELIRADKVPNCRIETVEARMDKSTPVIAITVYTDEPYKTSFEEAYRLMDIG